MGMTYHTVAPFGPILTLGTGMRPSETLRHPVSKPVKPHDAQQLYSAHIRPADGLKAAYDGSAVSGS